MSNEAKQASNLGKCQDDNKYHLAVAYNDKNALGHNSPQVSV